MSEGTSSIPRPQADPLLIETAANVLNNMMRGRHFDICAVRKAAGLLDVPMTGASFKRLEKLHCVDWSDMPQALRDEIPRLISNVMSSTAFQFTFAEPPPPPPPPRPVIEHEPRKRWLPKLLGGGS